MKFLRTFQKPLLFIGFLNLLLVMLVGAGLHSADRPSSRQVRLEQVAAQIFEREKANPNRDMAYLSALSTALRFQDYGRVEELVHRYDTHNL